MVLELLEMYEKPSRRQHQRDSLNGATDRWDVWEWRREEKINRWRDRREQTRTKERREISDGKRKRKIQNENLKKTTENKPRNLIWTEKSWMSDGWEKKVQTEKWLWEKSRWESEESFSKHEGNMKILLISWRLLLKLKDVFNNKVWNTLATWLPTRKGWRRERKAAKARTEFLRRAGGC